MTLNTVTPQELEMMNYIEQQIRDNYTMQLAINHHLIKLDYILSANNIFLSINIYLGETTIVIDKIDLLIKVEEVIEEFDTVEKLQAIANKQLTQLVTLSDSMLELEQTILSNNNK